MSTTIENPFVAQIKCVATFSSHRLSLNGGAKAVLDVLEESLQSDDRKIKRTEETLGGYLFPELPIILRKPKRTLKGVVSLHDSTITIRGKLEEALAVIRDALQIDAGPESSVREG